MVPTYINFNTSNLIIFCYPDYAGGNFVMNSLGLSDQAVFPLPSLAEKQLAGTFTPGDKLNYLIGAVAKEQNTSSWSDMQLSGGMRDNSLFGMLHNTHGMTGPMGMVPGDVLPQFLFSNTLAKLANNDWTFFLGVHHPMQVDFCLGIWPNAKIVVFDNYRPFLKFRRRHRSHESILQPHWTDIRGDTWPTVAPASLEEFNLLPISVKQEVVNDFADFYNILVSVDEWRIKFLNNYDQSIEKYKVNPNAILWNTDDYFSEERTVAGVEKLYNHFHLPDFNAAAVKTYYQSWFEKIKTISEYK